jgi:hypothetical protein
MGLNFRWIGHLVRRKRNPFGKEGRALTRTENAGLSIIKNRKKSLAFTPYAKRWVREHPGVIKAFLEARRIVSRGMSSATVGTLRLEKVHGRGIHHSALFKARVDSHTFFVKEADANEENIFFNPELDHAEGQIIALHSARPLLEKLDRVRIANYHLGWTSSNRSFLVTDFYEGIPMDILENPHLRSRYQRIHDVLSPYFRDIEPRNSIYLPKEDTIVIFDLEPIPSSKSSKPN